MLPPSRISLIEQLQSVGMNGFNQNIHSGDTKGVFRTHYDWHSSVHGHWMLLSSARILKNSELASKILNRLSDEELSHTQKQLNQNSKFELPYGQAWLLLLIQELQNHNRLTQTAAELKKETLNRVVTWLENTEFPETGFNAYHSWMITYFLMKQTDSRDLSSRVHKLDLKFQSVDQVNDKNDPNDFFSSESLFAILKKHPKNELVLAHELVDFGPVTFKNCHILGKLVSRAWITPKNHIHAPDFSLRFTQSFMKFPEYWKSDFSTVGHWVPQFLWMGLFLSHEFDK